jgi:ABC-type nitrate/sulfonate/bicarbonate transport system ATPase subunit
VPQAPPHDAMSSEFAPVAGSAVEISGVRQQFGSVIALERVDISVSQYERLGIVGPSGCGKSTLLSGVAGLLEPSDGTISIGRSRTAKERLSRCALMPQRDLLLPWRTALDNGGLALENRGASRAQARATARPLFERFGLGQFEDKLPAQLSGGMRQRVAFLRTLLAGKEVLLLDEPFGALDSITRGQMQEWLLTALEQEPRTVLLVTHDVDEALLLSDHVAVMSPRPGQIVRKLESTFPRNLARREIVTSPEFATLKEQALEALEM